jgi:hypothetical protein
VKVLKTDKQPDGSYLSEVKDTKTGETFMLLDRPGEFSPADERPAKTTRPADPLLPKSKTAEEPKEKERRLFGNIFSSRSSAAMPAKEAPRDEEERPGLLKRLFGRKSSSSTTSEKPGMPAGAAMPPPVRPAPGVPLISPGTTEPPRSKPVERLSPPTAVIPSRMTPPTAPPASGPPPLAFPITTTPATPMPVIPRVVPHGTGPTPPAPPVTSQPVLPGLPSIPALPPGGQSRAQSGITQAAHSETAPSTLAGLNDEVAALQSGSTPSRRALAARALAGGWHATSDAVRRMILATAESDPSALVRAVCIEELSKLDYRNPAFVAYLKKACTDPSDEVKRAATAALSTIK